ncbi:hypothetical protein [Ralstonia insidiosa]|jgi:hypothetical protein|nr:hypothetical protein [Ralstonia insidiosa]MBA9939891.1 hypothetical protein [Ralstonia insidiosa]MBC9968553.1 hypothetical protein [Ralstonia insidiosa]MBX3904626.1 hypothetical protein [Ralstonia insidiosa]
MKHTVSALKHLSSTTDDAKKIAAEFCREVLAEASQRQRRLSAIADLETILDAEQLAIAADARAGVRHLVAGVLEVSEYNKNGSMAGWFDETLKELAKLQEQVESKYSWLQMLYTRD